MPNATTKYHPIIFDAESIRAIFDDRKSQTRRVVAPPPREYATGLWDWAPKRPPGIRGASVAELEAILLETSRWKPGDRLWVKETWAVSGQFRDGTRYEYKAFPADGQDERSVGGRWKSPRFMPRAASRITLEVTAVRIERLQEVSDEDAIAEGGFLEQEDKTRWHRPAFVEHWDALNAKRGFPWENNDWVRVTEFRRVTEAVA